MIVGGEHVDLFRQFFHLRLAHVGAGAGSEIVDAQLYVLLASGGDLAGEVVLEGSGTERLDDLFQVLDSLLQSLDVTLRAQHDRAVELTLGGPRFCASSRKVHS